MELFGKKIPQDKGESESAKNREEKKSKNTLGLLISLILFLKTEIMKRRWRSITDLSHDVLQHILVHVAKSSNGPVNLARTLSVCRLFRQLGQDKIVLAAVAYNKASLPLLHPSFWQINGLLVRCMCIGNVSVGEIERKYAMELHERFKVLKRVSTPQILDVMAKTRAVETVNTRSRRKAFESANKKYDVFIGHIDDLEQRLEHMLQIHKLVESHQSSGECLN